MSWRDLVNEERYEMRISWGLGGELGMFPIVFVALPEPDRHETMDKLEWALEFIQAKRGKHLTASILRGNYVPVLMLECNAVYLRQRRDGSHPPPPIVRWLAKNLPAEIDLPLPRLTLYIVYYGPDKVQVLQETKEQFV